MTIEELNQKQAQFENFFKFNGTNRYDGLPEDVFKEGSHSFVIVFNEDGSRYICGNFKTFAAAVKGCRKYAKYYYDNLICSNDFEIYEYEIKGDSFPIVGHYRNDCFFNFIRDPNL